jgi:hypothetical protein
MGIRKSTGFLAGLVVALAATSIGLLVALLLAKQQANGSESSPSNGRHRSDVPLGAPTVSKDWDDVEEPESGTETSGESATSGRMPERPGEADPDLPVQPWEKDIRMPKSVIPVHYDIYLFPDLIEGLFSGTSENGFAFFSPSSSSPFSNCSFAFTTFLTR